MHARAAMIAVFLATGLALGATTTQPLPSPTTPPSRPPSRPAPSQSQPQSQPATQKAQGVTGATIAESIPASARPAASDTWQSAKMEVAREALKEQWQGKRIIIEVPIEVLKKDKDAWVIEGAPVPAIANIKLEAYCTFTKDLTAQRAAALHDGQKLRIEGTIAKLQAAVYGIRAQAGQECRVHLVLKDCTLAK